ncbi:MAG: hypothetical protein IID03_12855 [Candidatus Dadabacteria bacterium]|nr:hypothetical protein [Candidatus Dadabacteria bacterium]
MDNQKTNVVFTITSRLFHNGRFTYSLGIPIKTADWDNKNGRFRAGKTFPNGDRRNKILKSILNRIQEVTERGDGIPISRELLREERLKRKYVGARQILEIHGTEKRRGL